MTGDVLNAQILVISNLRDAKGDYYMTIIEVGVFSFMTQSIKI